MAQYTKPASTVQRVCNNPAKIIALQAEITNLKTQAFLPPLCDHTEMEYRIWTFLDEFDDGRRRPMAAGTDEELLVELAVMTQAAQ